MSSAQAGTVDSSLAGDSKQIHPSKAAIWGGYVMSALPSLLLVFSGVMKIAKPAPVVEGFQKLGYPENVSVPIGIVEILCVVIYAIPRTAVLGAILITGYLGGATATNVRVGESWIMCVVMGVVVWGGLYLRDPRLRALLPLRRRVTRA